MRNDMSPEARAGAARRSPTPCWETVAAGRRPGAAATRRSPIMSPIRRRFMPAAGGDMAQAALRAGLVDRIGDRTPVRPAHGRARRHMTRTCPRPLSTRSIYDGLGRRASGQPIQGGEIGILTVAGTIVDGEAGPSTAGGETIARNLERGARGQQSQGAGRAGRFARRLGARLGADPPRRSCRARRARHSGGHRRWVRSRRRAAIGSRPPATSIFAEPSTITGSIGVFGILPSFEGTLRQAQHRRRRRAARRRLSGRPDLLRGPSPEASELLQTGGREHLSPLRRPGRAGARPAAGAGPVRSPRDGCGTAARRASCGLVDRFGSLDDAVAEAARRALDPRQRCRGLSREEPGCSPSALIGGAAAAGQYAPARARRLRRGCATRPEAVIERGSLRRCA